MRVPFRQGLVRYQTDNAPTPNQTFLQASNGGTTIDLVVAPDPTIIAFANGTDNDYLFEERLSVPEAWTGPFVSGTDYWAYWDIDTFTAERTFGHTEYEPIVALTPPVGPEGQHWFDSQNKSMKVMTNGIYIEKIRVFACKYASGAVIEAFPLGTQAAETTTSFPGFILFDDLGNAVRKVKNRRFGHFVTSESNFHSHASNAQALKFEAQIYAATAVENIAAFQCISYKQYDKIGFASRLDIDRIIVGVIREDLFAGEVGHFISAGFITNPLWNWNESVGTKLYCDDTGQITTDIPQLDSLQEIGIIISPTAILLNIQPQIIVEN